jgi:hypothetical protein
VEFNPVFTATKSLGPGVDLRTLRHRIGFDKRDFRAHKDMLLEILDTSYENEAAFNKALFEGIAYYFTNSEKLKGNRVDDKSIIFQSTITEHDSGQYAPVPRSRNAGKVIMHHQRKIDN